MNPVLGSLVAAFGLAIGSIVLLVLAGIAHSLARWIRRDMEWSRIRREADEKRRRERGIRMAPAPSLLSQVGTRDWS